MEPFRVVDFDGHVDVVRAAKAPDQLVLSFLNSTYEAAANLASWDRAALEWAAAAERTAPPAA